MESYGEEFNTKLADEVSSLPSGVTAIPEALGDYATLRDRISACIEAREQ